jgi:hypothetical protein
MTTQRFTTRAMSYVNPTARCRSLAPVRYTAETTNFGGYMKDILVSSIMVFLLSGCTTQLVFVVSRDVPQSPSFVVIPANDYLSEVEFANQIESYLLSCAVKVVTRPAIKDVQATKQAAQIEAKSSQAEGTQATLVERYAAFEDTDADYVVRTYADMKQFKIVRKVSKEILLSFELKENPKKEPDQIIREALITLGIKVR